MENTSVEAKDEKLGEEVDTSKTTSETTEETTTSEATKSESSADSGEESFYEKEVKRLEAEKRQKDGALKEERRLRKEAEAKIKAQAEGSSEDSDEKPLTAKQLEKLFAEKMAERDFEQALRSKTADANEQKLTRYHYENSIRKTGNVDADLSMALAIANQHIVQEAKSAQVEREQSEALSASFMGGRTYSRQGRPVYESDPRLKKAADLLDKIGAGDAKKFLK